MAALLALCALLTAEAVALCLGQRRLFWTAVDATGSRLLGYVLALPGTVLHESAHYAACVVLRVPVGRQVRTAAGGRARVRLFYPQRDRRTGSVTLGSVPHAATDPLRGALIAVAPVLLVPPLLLALVLLITGTGDPARLAQLLPHLPPWKLVLLGYLSFSCGLAAFPSRGDHIGPLGGFTLIAAGAATILAIVSHGGQAELIRVVRAACLLLAVPALASTISLIVLGAVARERRGR